jgi:hypothetical protein
MPMSAAPGEKQLVHAAEVAGGVHQPVQRGVLFRRKADQSRPSRMMRMLSASMGCGT